MSYIKKTFTTSGEVYANCLNTHSNSIVNKNLIKTEQSNNMRIAQKLASTNLGGKPAFVNRGPPNIYGEYAGQGAPLRNKF